MDRERVLVEDHFNCETVYEAVEALEAAAGKLGGI
jgi:hypothetical protein